jgi:hypothetical protein
MNPMDDPDAGMISAADTGVLAFACDGPGEFRGGGGQGCYLQSVVTASWFAARNDCQEWGGDLVVVESLEEDALLTGRMTADVWIGARRDPAGVLVWVDSQPLVYENWSGTQPDDFQGLEDCVEKRVAEGGEWNDRPCTGDPQAYFCER